LTSGGGTEIGSPEISRFSVAGEVKLESAAGGKLQEYLIGREGASICGPKGSKKLGENILPNPFMLRTYTRRNKTLAVNPGGGWDMYGM